LADSRSDGVHSPDFYVAAIGRSGSTMLCNWLSRPPAQLVFVEPFFTRARNPELLRIQLEEVIQRNKPLKVVLPPSGKPSDRE